MQIFHKNLSINPREEDKEGEKESSTIKYARLEGRIANGGGGWMCKLVGKVSENK